MDRGKVALWSWGNVSSYRRHWMGRCRAGFLRKQESSNLRGGLPTLVALLLFLMRKHLLATSPGFRDTISGLVTKGEAKPVPHVCGAAIRTPSHPHPIRRWQRMDAHSTRLAAAQGGNSPPHILDVAFHFRCSPPAIDQTTPKGLLPSRKCLGLWAEKRSWAARLEERWEPKEELTRDGALLI